MSAVIDPVIIIVLYVFVKMPAVTIAVSVIKIGDARIINFMIFSEKQLRTVIKKFVSVLAVSHIVEN